MKLYALVNFYKYTIDLFDVYEYETDIFLYTAHDIHTVGGPDIYVKNFAVYEADEKTVLEIWI